MYISLSRYNFVAKVINNMEVKNSFGLEITDVTCPRKTYANYEWHYTLYFLMRIVK